MVDYQACSDVALPPIKAIYSMRKETHSLSPAAHEIALHLDTPSLLDSEGDDPHTTDESLAEHMLEAQPVLNSNFGAAADRARMAAGSRIDADEWLRLQEELREGADDPFGEVEGSRAPVPVGYVYALRFQLDQLVIAEVDEIDRESHLAFRETHMDVDLLWLPNIGQSAPNVRIRVVTHRDLSEHFDVIRATPIEGWSRPPQES
jgi:hypothetical protein